jgi:hypothetical protein
MRTKHYSDYVSHLAAMMGMASSDLGDTELGMLNTFFDGAIKKIWRTTSWLETTRTGEYRVANNLIRYPNELDLDYWVKGGVTASASSAPNPVDTHSDAQAFYETSDLGLHRVLTFVPNTQNTPHTASVFAKPLGTRYLFLLVQDALGATFRATFDLQDRVVVSLDAGVTATITNAGELWSQCTLNFTPAFGQSALILALSADGITPSYVGNTSKGMFLWGASMIQNSAPGISTQLIPWEQSGYPEIDTVYEVYNRSPLNTTLAARVGYKPTSNGIQLFGVNTAYDGNAYAQSPQAGSYPTGTIPFGPVYLNYRIGVPEFSGANWADGTTYSPGTIVYAANGDGSYDHYKCRITSLGLGQSPQSTPNRWELQVIPYSFFEFICTSAFADWLRTEGQFTKADAMENKADALIIDELERQEREMDILPNFKVNTHVTSRATYTR